MGSKMTRAELNAALEERRITRTTHWLTTRGHTRVQCLVPDARVKGGQRCRTITLKARENATAGAKR